MLKSVEIAESTSIPPALTNISTHPNPFQFFTEIHCEIHVNSKITLEIYDLGGKRIKTIYDGYQAAGFYHYYWDATDAENKTVRSGVYICTLRTEKDSKTIKIVRQ
jgi:flagellar hook assembly protein FlgD